MSRSAVTSRSLPLASPFPCVSVEVVSELLPLLRRGYEVGLASKCDRGLSLLPSAISTTDTAAAWAVL